MVTNEEFEEEMKVDDEEMFLKGRGLVHAGDIQTFYSRILAYFPDRIV